MIKALQSCQTRDDIAILLGYSPASLSFILYQIPDDAKYTPFIIKKKDGSDRTILAPIARLKTLQRKVSDLLYDCIAEIKEGATATPYSSLTGFSKGIGIYDNAQAHVGRRYVFNIDLEDFFPSIHIGRVIGFFTKDNNFGLAYEVARTIGQIACHEGRLPQGSPCSPVISNLVASVLDARLARFAGRHSCTYTRYADDITFSTNKKDFPPAIALPADDQQGWVASEELSSRISAAGFQIKTTKTRMSLRTSRQSVTGLVVNAKPNVPEEFYKRTRAMVHRLFAENAPYEHHFYNEDPEEEGVWATLPYIEGRLSHIYGVKSKTEHRDLRARQDDPRNYFALYRDFLIYKTFYAQRKPLIITEGESDRIYLRLAASALFPSDPAFAVSETGRRALAFRTLNYTHRLAEIVGLAGGTGHLIKTLVQVKDFHRRFPKLTPKQPVIILVDNDSGAKPLWGPTNQLFSVKPTAADEDFLRLKRGLYVIRTPLLAGKQETLIESFLPATVLTQKVGGKTFNPQATFDTANHFGKVRLAQIVASTASAVNFSGFAPLLERFRSAWADWPGP